MILQDVTKYENDKSIITVYMESDKDDNYHFLKHIEEKESGTENLIRYSLETFMAEYKMIQKFGGLEEMPLRLLSPYQCYTEEQYQACKRVFFEQFPDWVPR